MYEHHKQPLISRRQYYRRITVNLAIAIIVLGIALGIGILGYHFYFHLGWTDALLNASMILSGMGPVDTKGSNGAKIFASAYALFSGVVFISSIGVIVAPILHRALHRFHLRVD